MDRTASANPLRSCGLFPSTGTERVWAPPQVTQLQSLRTPPCHLLELGGSIYLFSVPLCQAQSSNLESLGQGVRYVSSAPALKFTPLTAASAEEQGLRPARGPPSLTPLCFSFLTSSGDNSRLHLKGVVGLQKMLGIQQVLHSCLKPSPSGYSQSTCGVSEA